MKFTGADAGDGPADVGASTKPIHVGGAIAVNTHQLGGAVTTGGTLVIENSIFNDNLATAGGGAIYCGKCALTISGSKFSRNKETNVPGYRGVGGAAYLFCSPKAFYI